MYHTYIINDKNRNLETKLKRLLFAGIHWKEMPRLGKVWGDNHE